MEIYKASALVLAIFWCSVLTYFLVKLHGWTGDKRRFDFFCFAKTLSLFGGILYLVDISWFAWDGSNIDYSLPFIVWIVFAAVLISFRRKSQ